MIKKKLAHNQKKISCSAFVNLFVFFCELVLWTSICKPVKSEVVNMWTCFCEIWIWFCELVLWTWQMMNLSLKSMGLNLWVWNLKWAWTCEFEIWNLNLTNVEDGKWWTCESEISECEPVIQSENWDRQPFANDEAVNLNLNLNLWTYFPKSVKLCSTVVCRSPSLAASLVLRWYLPLWILYIIVMFVVLYLCFILIFNFRGNARALT
jgi:hypothetical protein